MHAHACMRPDVLPWENVRQQMQVIMCMQNNVLTVAYHHLPYCTLLSKGSRMSVLPNCAYQIAAHCVILSTCVHRSTTYEKDSK